MAITVTFNGVDYQIPTMGESANWGTSLNEYLVALSAANVGASGVTSLGNLYSGSDAKAAAIAGSVLSLQQASTTFPGVMSAADKVKLDAMPSIASFITTTTDATPVNISLGPLTVAASSVVAVQAVVTAVSDSGTQAMGWGLVTTFKRGGAGAAQLAGTRELWVHNTDRSWLADLAASTNDIVATVTGEAATTIDWLVTIQTIVMAAP